MPTITSQQQALALAKISAIAETKATYTNPALWWSIALDDPGRVVQNEGDLSQCIAIILQTPRGSDPFRPSFAGNLHDYLDWPQNAITPQIVRECYEAIAKWEPRIEVEGVRVYFNDEAIGRVDVAIDWKLKEGVETGTTTVTID